MNNIVTNWEQILNFGQKYGLPLSKKKGILREYLQTKILDLIYQEKISADLVFVGGTAMRLTRGLDRFSEDLDFDLTGISFQQAKKMVTKICEALNKQNITVDLYENETEDRIYHEFRFTKLLYQLDLGQQETEKLTIKLDYGKFWRGHVKEVILINRYGYLVQTVTISLDQLLVQKLFAYTKRKQTLARDIYDVVWLTAQGAKIDRQFMKKNKIRENLVEKAIKDYEIEKIKMKTYKARLEPFLINEKNIEKLDLFPVLLKSIK